MIRSIERGAQVGIEKRIFREQNYFWYSYALQKKDNVYYVYESEIAENHMAEEVYEYEMVCKYLSVEDVREKFPCRYGICFEDIHVLKGKKIFNVSFYV